jgi:hypothetical protein
MAFHIKLGGRFAARMDFWQGFLWGTLRILRVLRGEKAFDRKDRKEKLVSKRRTAERSYWIEHL